MSDYPRGPVQWCRDRRVSSKVLTVAGVAVLGTVVTGVFSLVGVGNLAATRDSEIARKLPYATHLNAAALAAKAAANDERGYLIAGATSFRNEAMGRRSTVNAELAAARAVADPAGRGRVDAIGQGTERWFAAIDAEFTRYRSDRAGATTLALDGNRQLRKAYEDLLNTEIKRADQALLHGTAFDRTVRSIRAVVLAVLLIVVLLAVGVALFVARLIVRPLRQVVRVLDGVAAGDLTGEAVVHQRDEIGHMAGSLRRATGSLRETVTDLGTHAAQLAAEAETLAGTSRRSSAGAEQGARQAAAVSDSAEAMSRNIHTVAAGAEEMGASIREISQSATQAAEVASRAVEVAAATTAVMAKLNESSGEIGNVIKTITAIAEQTNLLALNATIEAARAGEAGKGFAVVASEVKELSQETARATDDIGARVETIQNDASGAVHTIGEISEIVGRINDLQTIIAAAVEEQTVTTNEMSRNVNEAAEAGGRVAGTIAEVAASVQLTTTGVAESERAAGNLAEMSGGLRRIVERFRL